MKITAWRIVHEKHRTAGFDGEGARLFGGRFNGRGTPMVYTSTTLSLAMLELLVHLDRTRPLARHVAVSVTFEDSLLRYIDPSDLPQDWRRSVTPVSTQLLGDRWIESGPSVALAVPSVLLPDEMFGREQNIIINPRHQRFPDLEFGEQLPLHLDTRL